MLRRNKERPIILIAALLVAVGELISTGQALAQTTAYLVTDLSVDDATQIPVRMNNLGDLVGRARGAVNARPQATFWTHSSLTRKNLGTFTGGDYSSATGINDTGEVVGVSNTGTGIIPFLWTATGGLKRVPLLAGDNCGQAGGINRYGHLVGYSSGRNGVKAFLWLRSGGLKRLDTLPGGSYSKARDVNDGDEIVGTSDSSAGVRAVLWTKAGNVSDLGTLPGDYASEATSINNNGDVVGYSKGSRGMRAFLWNRTEGMQDLGVLAGGDSSRALAISNLGEVVGSSTTPSGDHAFIWTREAGMVDLNNATSAALGMVLFEAHSINDKGKILAMGRNAVEADMHSATAPSADEYCAPVPPATFLLTPTTAP